MSDFEQKLSLYKTAYSPEFSAFVGIKNVYFDEIYADYYVQATVAGHGDKLYDFLVEDLVDYVL